MVLSGEVLGEQPDISMIETYSRDNGFVRNHLSPAERQALDRLISACLRAEDASSRLLLLTEWQETMKRACNVLFLYHSVQVAGHHRSLGGVAMNAWGKINYKDIWVRP
jgi:MarR-like DNA-binding transcriptional regulator SgrR of sgrS sRNA